MTKIREQTLHRQPGRTIISRQEITGDIVKSAARVLQILEYFDIVKRDANVVEISTQLKYPQSSTSVLLRSLVKLGYLNYDSSKRTYVSSLRVALLGNWVGSACLEEGTIMQSMRELSNRTGDTIVLAVRNGIFAQYIHVLQAVSPARLHIGVGTVRPIAASATGFAMLGLMKDSEISRLVRRINAETDNPDAHINQNELMETIRDVRKNGYAFGANLVTPGGAMIIAPLPVQSDSDQLFLGVAGISEVMLNRKDALAGHLLETIEAFFGKSPKTVYNPGLLTGSDL